MPDELWSLSLGSFLGQKISVHFEFNLLFRRISVLSIRFVLGSIHVLYFTRLFPRSSELF